MGSLIILSIVILTTNLLWAYYLKEYTHDRDYAEQERIRELMRAVKSNSVTEYNESIPNDTPLPQEEKGDELLEINDESIPDSTIIKALKREHDDKQNKN